MAARQQSSLSIRLIIIVVVLVAGAFWATNGFKIPFNSNAVVNALPASGSYFILEGTVDPGLSVTVEEVILDQPGIVAVLLERQGMPEETVGMTDEMVSGTHSNVVIPVRTPLVDGDIIYVQLQNVSGEPILDEAGTPVQIMKPVGTPMLHYYD